MCLGVYTEAHHIGILWCLDERVGYYESLIKTTREGRAKFLVNSKQKGRCPCECSGMCSAFLLLWCLCRDGHRFTAQLLYFTG